MNTKFIEQLSAESLAMVQDSLRRECGVSEVPDSWITVHAVADACLQSAEEDEGGVTSYGTTPEEATEKMIEVCLHGDEVGAGVKQELIGLINERGFFR
jgi:hypothetical protein